MVLAEVAIITERKRKEQAGEAAVLQTVLGSIISKAGGREMKKVMSELQDYDAVKGPDEDG